MSLLQQQEMHKIFGDLTAARAPAAGLDNSNGSIE